MSANSMFVDWDNSVWPVRGPRAALAIAQSKPWITACPPWIGRGSSIGLDWIAHKETTNAVSRQQQELYFHGRRGVRKVSALCTRYRKKIKAHAWSTGITMAASLHCSLASPNTIIFECKPLRAAVQDVIVAEKLWHKDGWAYPISGHGMGIEVIEAEVRKIAP